MCKNRLHLGHPLHQTMQTKLSKLTIDTLTGSLMATPYVLKRSLCKLSPLAVLYTIYLGEGLLQKESLGLVGLSVTALFPSIYLHYHQTW